MIVDKEMLNSLLEKESCWVLMTDVQKEDERETHNGGATR
jgi:hypothetical protein